MTDTLQFFLTLPLHKINIKKIMTGNEMRIVTNEIFDTRVDEPFYKYLFIIDGGLMFSNKLTYLVLLILALTIFGCSENPTIVNDEQWQIPTSIESPCGERYFDLYIDRTTLAGIVGVANDLDNVYITYTLDGTYLAEPGEMHVWLGPAAPTKRGNPKQYPFHSVNSDYVSTYSFTLPLSDIQQYINVGTFYFMTYISVVTPDGGGYSSASDGFSVEIVKIKSKGAWYGYNSYTLQDCGAQ